MKAVLMAGGEGSRLRPLTVGRPKPMVPVANMSVMAHILGLLKSHGITDIVVTLRYMASSIQDFFEDGKGLGVNLTYVVEESPLGTAGSVKNAARYLDDTFLVISGDALTDLDLGQIVAAHRARGAQATLTLTHVQNPLEYGVTIVDDEGWITQFLEKPSWGEVLSDTVNSGIYVLEPTVLDLIPDDTPFDFSMELFPTMLSQRNQIYGHVADGYWCDIGNLDEYRRSNADILHGKVNLPQPIGTHIGGGVWVGEGVEIAPSAQLFGPIYLGNGVKIKGDVTIHGPTVIRDYTVVDNYSRIERSVIWRNNYIGESCELRGAIIMRQCTVKSKVVAFEGVVVGDFCMLGEGSVLHADVKLWPHKEIEAGVTVRDSIIWGNQGRRALFGRYGVSGVVNVDLTPEFAAKLGAALGATLRDGGYVAINRDAHRTSRMLKRALISGIPGTGINVWDLGSVAIPVLRHFVRTHKDAVAGIHVRLSPFDQRVVDIRFIDTQGLNQSKAAERSVERTFFREDFRRAYLDEVGTIEYAQRPIDDYARDFLDHVDLERIRQAHARVVIDYSFGLAADSLADILTKLNVEVVALNARVDETKLAMLEGEFLANRVQVSKIAPVLNADFGVQLDVGGEKFFLVDDQGVMLDELTTAALMVELALHAHPGGTVAVPITFPNAFDTIVRWHSGSLLRVGSNLHSLMATAQNEMLLLVADGSGNFIFPDFQPAVDGMMAVVRLLEYLAVRQKTVSQVVAYLPKFHLARCRVDCPWDVKAKIMRQLNARYAGQPMQNIDGLKLHLDNQEWVHFAPDPERPVLEIVAEAADPDRAAALLEQYSQDLRDLLSNQMA